MKNLRIIYLLTFIFLSSQIFAQRTIQIKMASPVPENTPWGNCLNLIANDWRRITNGQVDMIIYHNGTAGKEEAVVRNMRLNQLQAAVLSPFGLTEVFPEVMTLVCPFFIRNDDELDLVLSEIKDELEEKINSAGFHTLAWARVGWIKFFSKTPILTPNDLKQKKLGTLSEYEKINQALKTMGYQLVPVTQNELLISLSGPMVDAIYNSPTAVGSAQAFGSAKNMSSINIAPFIGAVLVNQRTWNLIPDRFKPQLIESVRRREAELDVAVKAFEDDIIATMGNYGLIVNQLTPAQEQLWYDEFKRAEPNLVGSVFDRQIYNRIDVILRNYRNRQR